MLQHRYFTVILMSLSLTYTTACSKEKTYWEWGEVTRISGTLPELVKSSGALFGNEAVKLGDQTLVYTIKANDGEMYTVDIVELGKVSRVNLMTRVCVGTHVSFPVVRVDKGIYIANPGIGSAMPENIHVPTSCTK